MDDDAGGSVDDDIEGILVFYNSGTSKVEMWMQEAGTAANNFTDETTTQLATFDNVAAGTLQRLLLIQISASS